MLAILFGCGLRRSELVGLKFDDVQVRQGHWAIVDLVGKGGHIRTVPIPNWAKAALDLWIAAAGIAGGKIFRAVARTGKVWGKGISQNVVWYVVKSCCEKAGLLHIAPHDLRRTCAKLCHSNGGEIEQIQFLLGHASIQTTGTLSWMQAEPRSSGKRSVSTGHECPARGGSARRERAFENAAGSSRSLL
jgi:integrase